jgi:hypothetical protein
VGSEVAALLKRIVHLRAGKNAEYAIIEHGWEGRKEWTVSVRQWEEVQEVPRHER